MAIKKREFTRKFNVVPKRMVRSPEKPVYMVNAACLSNPKAKAVYCLSPKCLKR